MFVVVLVALGVVERSALGFCSRFLLGLCVLRPCLCGTGLKFCEGGVV
jgi:hypothetical protein